jgi:hypothetical protein
MLNIFDEIFEKKIGFGKENKRQLLILGLFSLFDGLVSNLTGLMMLVVSKEWEIPQY